MYYDIFLSNPVVTFEDSPDGVIVYMPGNNTGIVYAVSEREKGFLHCLVTEAQLAQLEVDNFPFKYFNAADNRYKRDGKGPNHVFNPGGCLYRENGKDFIHAPKADTPVEVSPVSIYPCK